MLVSLADGRIRTGREDGACRTSRDLVVNSFLLVVYLYLNTLPDERVCDWSELSRHFAWQSPDSNASGGTTGSQGSSGWKNAGSFKGSFKDSSGKAGPKSQELEEEDDEVGVLACIHLEPQYAHNLQGMVVRGLQGTWVPCTCTCCTCTCTPGL